MSDEKRHHGESVHVSRDDLVALGANALAQQLLDLASRDQDILKVIRGRLRDHAVGQADTGETGPGDNEPHMVGSSPAMRELFSTIRKLAVAGDAQVLITGESGTGKELAAKAIHERSDRAMGPFAVINCAALPPTLIRLR